MMDMYHASPFLLCGRGVPAVWKQEQGMLGLEREEIKAADIP